MKVFSFVWLALFAFASNLALAESCIERTQLGAKRTAEAIVDILKCELDVGYSRDSNPLFHVFSGAAVGSLNISSTSQIQDSAIDIARLVESGQPVLLTDISETELAWISTKLPIKPVQKSSSGDANEGGMAVYFVDTFQDLNGGSHYRVISVPIGRQLRKLDMMVLTSDERGRMSSVNQESHFANTDASLLDNYAGREKYLAEIVGEIRDYLLKCGGSSPDIVQCFNYMHNQHNFENQKNRKDFAIRVQGEGSEHTFDGASGMVPDGAAVWREIIQTSFRHWTFKWGSPFPFDKDQVVSHRLNSYWYVYLQAPPYQEMYYVFLLVDGLHNPNTQLVIDEAVGGYISNLELKLQAFDSHDKPDTDNIFWVKSNPPTQNTQHTIGKSWSSTDSYSLSMNLGFKAKEFFGGIKFNYTKTFTASYSETREITDWGVVENTDPVIGRGEWRYYQSWPVDMQNNGLRNFPKNWEQYYERNWGPCIVKTVPNLSRYALGTHDTMVWAVDPKLKSEDGRHLPVRFRQFLQLKVTAHTCEVYDGHHKLAQVTVTFSDMEWEINVADLNNIDRA